MKLFFTISFFLLSFSMAEAAKIYIEPVSRIAHPNDVFLYSIRLDTEDECINAVEVELLYDPELLRFVDFGRGGSLLLLWIQEPTVSQEKGQIIFSGGVPGGYCGRIRGDVGPSNILGKVAFSFTPKMVESAVESSLFFSDKTKAYMNDGFGTPATLTYEGATVSVSDRIGRDFTNEWLAEVRGDNIAPEFFTIEIEQNQSVQNGKFFIVFGTNDKQSGLNHYEVLETDPRRFGFWISRNKASYWIVAESPYILRDQTLSSKILVKAVDEAGNERIQTVTPDGALFRSHTRRSIPEFLIVLSLIIGCAYMYRRFSRNKFVDNNKE